MTAAAYAPFGGLVGMSSGAKPITISNSYNKRLQPAVLSAATSTNTIMSLSYNFQLGVANNGNVYQIVNNRDNNRTQNFAYDGLNRITTGYSSGPNWGETFSTDAWGNLSNRNPVAGKTYYEPLSAGATNQNHLTGFNYDAAGNMTGNGSTTYVYDGENRLVWTSGYRYMFDGDGKRVEKCVAGSSTTACPTSGTNGTMYWTGIGSDPLEESDLSGNSQEQYVFFNGKRIARWDASTHAVHYYFSDHLGTHSLITDAIGTMPPQSESDYYPYGGEIPITTGDPNHYKFTGKERDAESGLDNFGARFDASSLGRFMSVDWSANPSSVPYASFGDPQTLNLYAYGRNNPTSVADKNGHCFDGLTTVVCIAAAVAAVALYKAGMVPQVRVRSSDANLGLQ